MTTRFQRSMKVVEGQLKHHLANGISIAAEVLAGEAQRLSPVKTGHLKKNIVARRSLEESTASRIVYTVGAEGVEYAIYVHEMPGPFKVGQPKFLEQPAREMMNSMGQYFKFEGSTLK